ncbi:hypothetical protein DVH05_007724 [Phytophthora capsici]|nr:hypothetical protein DVH05_007724 [Phytophthora capsici]
MPAKKQTKSPSDESAASIATSPSGANDPASTAVSLVSDLPLATKHTRISRSAYTPKVIGYESPLKKLKKTMSHHKQRTVIDTIGEF